MTGNTFLGKIIFVLIVVCLAVGANFAQTSILTYQGKLADSAIAANGPYDFTFKLYDTLSNGTQIGTDIVRDDVVVTDGIFSVDLDFGAAAFANGGVRFLQIEVRPGASSGTFTPLVPRQPVTSSPYSVKTINATTADSLSPTCVSCVTDTNIDTVNAGKVTGVLAQPNGGTGLSVSGAAGNFLRSNGTNWTSSPFQASDIPVLGGSFIQNSTTTQPTSNFSISGTGRASVFNALTQYNIGGQRVLSNPSGNLFLGEGAGTSNSGGPNSFLGTNAGFSNTSGFGNSFVGNGAGSLNTTGNTNSFLGSNAGAFNTTGSNNSFYGAYSGLNNDTGFDNAFFGYEAGRASTTGSFNSFFGNRAGYFNTTGGSNSYFGYAAGGGNSTGIANSMFGETAGSSNTGGFNSFFGRASGPANTSGGDNSFFGSSSGQANTTGSNNTYVGVQAGFTNTTGSNNTTIGSKANVATGDLNYATAIGADAVVSSNNSVVLGRNVDTVRIPGNLNVTGSFSGSFTVPTTNITGVLSQTNGGTGLTAAGAPGNFLRSDGTNWTSSPFQASDIPILSTSFIQNSTTTQSASNFNISGDGTVGGTLKGGVVNAATQFNLNDQRVLAGTINGNLFVGFEAGASSTFGSNSFFGNSAGRDNATGTGNAFFGFNTGVQNSAGSSLAFFGHSAGAFNTSGDNNSFFGNAAGLHNGSGSANSFFGTQAGQFNSDGSSNNTVIGSFAGLGAGNLKFASAIGSNAVVGSNDTIVLGKSAGFYGGSSRPADTVQIPGNLNVAGNISGTFNGTIATANNALNLGGVPANQYVVTSDPRMTDARDPRPNSVNYIQNIPGIGTQSASFNITGGGNANVFNATTQYNIGGNRVLSMVGPTGSHNLFVGLGAGQSNSGTENTFVGSDAGLANNDARSNSFFGAGAGQNHIDGDFNSFFGNLAGASNRGNENSFFGTNAGSLNGTGSSNSFFGTRAGETNTFGDNNTFVGYRSNPLSSNLVNATAIGARAVVSQSHSLVLGSIANVNGAIGDTNVGIGTTAPAFRLDVVGRARLKQKLGSSGTADSAGLWFFQNTPNAERAFVGMENDTSVGFFGNNGGDWGLVMNTQTGITSIRSLAIVGVTSLCRNGQNEVSFCSSSLKYKTNISPFVPGLSFVNKLRPISFDWKDGGMKDVGFGAEDIAKIDTRFVTYNDKGEVEGVKYDRLGVAFVNAFREQQAEIDIQKSVISDQQRKIDDLDSKINLQQAQINALKKLVCSQNVSAEMCREEK